MRSVIVLAAVALVAVIGLALGFAQDSLTGQVHKAIYSEKQARPYLTAESAHTRLQKAQPLYLGMYQRCQAQADQNAWRCFERYDTTVAACVNPTGCHARKYLSDCLMTAQASRLNCGRFTARVMHDLGNVSSFRTN